MKKLTTTEGVFGPFKSIVATSTHYDADGCILPYSVYTENGVISDVEPEDLPPVTPPPAVPTVVTPRQARLVLALAPATDGVSPTLLAQVEAVFESLPEPQKTVAKVTWEYNTEVQRNNPLIAQMQAAIGFTAAQIDQLFIQASQL